MRCAFQHAIEQSFMGRIAFPFSHAPIGQLIQAKIKYPREGRLPHCSHHQRFVAHRGNQARQRLHVILHGRFGIAIGHANRGIIEHNFDSQPRRINGLHLFVPGSKVAQGEELSPICPRVIDSQRILHRAIPDANTNGSTPTDPMSYALKQLRILFGRRERSDPKVADQHGIERGFGE